MESLSASLCKGLGGGWRRRDYDRLDGSDWSCQRKKASSSEVAGGKDHHGQRRGFKVKPRLRFFMGKSTGKKFFMLCRDAYVKMMLGFANSRVFISGSSGGGGGNAFRLGKPTVKEYDEKVIIEIYKSLVGEGQLRPEGDCRSKPVHVTL